MLQKHTNRIKRHKRLRSKLRGTQEIPRVSVYRSNQHTYIQFIDDIAGKTLLSMNDVTAKLKGSKSEVASQLAAKAAEAAHKIGIEKIVFDRGGFKYHGRVKILAEALREAKLVF